MGVLDIAKAISELGILIIIAAFFLFTTMKMNKKQDEMLTTLFDKMLEQIKNCANGHVLTEEEDKTAVKIDQTLNLLLQKAVADLHCGRIMIVRYHNGGKDMNAISFLKLSITNESVNYGYTPAMGEFQNQFRSIVGYPTNEVITTGHSYVSDIEQIKEKDIGTYELLKSRGVRSYYSHGIKNSNGYIIGAVLVLYHKNNSYQENQEEIHHYLIHLTDQISSLLNVKGVQ